MYANAVWSGSAYHIYTVYVLLLLILMTLFFFPVLIIPQNGMVKGEVGQIKVKDISYKDIETILSMIQTSKEMQGEQGMFTETLT